MDMPRSFVIFNLDIIKCPNMFYIALKIYLYLQVANLLDFLTLPEKKKKIMTLKSKMGNSIPNLQFNRVTKFR